MKAGMGHTGAGDLHDGFMHGTPGDTLDHRRAIAGIRFINGAAFLRQLCKHCFCARGSSHQIYPSIAG